MDLWKRFQGAIDSSSGQRYQLVGGDGVFKNLKDRGSKVRSVFLAVGAVAFFVLLYISSRTFGGTNHAGFTSSTGGVAPGYLHLLFSAQNRDPGLCKTIVSAAVLDYPVPTFVGWEEMIEEGVEGRQYSPIEQIDQIQGYLSRFPDDDLAIVADGYTTWFQLRPQTLLDRYYEINRAADKRIRKELGGSLHLNQQIVFAAQKSCSPWTSEDPSCYAVPTSTLPAGIYGPQTDKTTGSEAEVLAQTRPRYLNSGFIMGNVKALRALFYEVSVRMREDSSLNSNQQVLSQIFGEQEVYREILRRDSKSWKDGLTGALSKNPRTALFKPSDIQKVKSCGRALEFGIGLDYESAIGLATEAATEDTAWLSFNDPSRLYTANEVLGIKQEDSRIESIGSDIPTTLPPFWTFSEEALPRGIKWDQVPLLTNVRTGVSPAVISHIDRASSFVTGWWDKVWFQKHARVMFNAHIYTPLGATAVGPREAPRSWWSPEDYKGGFRSMSGDWFRYDEICAGTEDEVFRDGQGQWWLPENH